MEPKKTSKADLENKRSTFILLGLVISLGIMFLAFNWSSPVQKADSLGEMLVQEVEDEMIPITRPEEEKPPPPPPPPQIEEFVIVDDDMEIEDELEILDTEADDETYVEIGDIVEEEDELEEEETFIVVEDMPEFPGGERALQRYIAKSLNYPIVAQENGIQGRVTVSFVVNSSGNVINASIARGVDPSLDKEALRVINSLPKFKPGRQRGKPVNVRYAVPINFQLQ